LGLNSRLREEFSFLRGNILVMMTSWLVMNFAGAIPMTYYSLFVLELGGTPFIIGIMEFISFLALASVQFPGGYLADKHGRKNLVVTFTFAMALANLFCVLAPSWHFVLLGVMLQNVFLGALIPRLQAIIADSIPSEKRGLGFSMFMLVNNAAAIFSPIVAGVLYLQYGLVAGVRIAYLIVVVMYLIAATVRIRLTETLKVNNDEELSLSGVFREYPRAVKEGFGVWKKLPRSMFFLFLTNAASAFVGGIFFPYQVVYATKVLHIDEFNWAFVMMWFTSSMVFLALPSGKLADRIGRKKPVVVSWVLFALFPLLFLPGGLYTLFVAYLFFGASNALFAAAYQAFEADLVPQELRGKEVGCSYFVVFVLMALGGLVGGFLYQSVSPMLPFILAFVETIPCAVITLLFIHEPKQKEK
jgi:MFS family permease